MFHILWHRRCNYWRFHHADARLCRRGWCIYTVLVAIGGAVLLTSIVHLFKMRLSSRCRAVAPNRRLTQSFVGKNPMLASFSFDFSSSNRALLGVNKTSLFPSRTTLKGGLLGS